MKYPCPVCALDDAITTRSTTTGGTYWDPPDNDFDIVYQECGCALSDEQVDELAERAANDPDDVDGDAIDVDFDDDPTCTRCGIYRSEHAGMGCQDGFTTSVPPPLIMSVEEANEYYFDERDERDDDPDE